MSEIKKLLLERHLEFWDDIYDVEKLELKHLKKYIDYIEKNLRTYLTLENDYKNIANFFMNKHLDYLMEAYTCILIKNYNAFACVMRIIIENYVSLFLIKKFKNKDAINNWYLWSIYKMLKKVESEEAYQNFKENYDLLCEKLNISNNYKWNTQAYGWLQNIIKLKNYSFKTASSLVDSQIYQDYSNLSGYIHNTDIYYKTNLIDMILLSHFIYLLFSFTDKMVRTYNPYITRRNEYRDLVQNLITSLDECINY